MSNLFCIIQFALYSLLVLCSLLLFLKLVHFWHFLSLTINVCGSSHTFVLSLCSLVFVSSKKWKAFKALMNHPWSLMDVLVKGNNGQFFLFDTEIFFCLYDLLFYIWSHSFLITLWDWPEAKINFKDNQMREQLDQLKKSYFV